MPYSNGNEVFSTITLLFKSIGTSPNITLKMIWKKALKKQDGSWYMGISFDRPIILEYLPL